MQRLINRTALITGASRGIGAAIARKLAAEGAKVVLTARTAEACAETEVACRALGAETLVVPVDVSKTEAVEECVKTVLAKFGRVDILVNNAGVTKDGLLMRMSDDDWDQVLGTNLKGTFAFIRALSRPMMKNKAENGLPAGGAIINITSVVGITGNAGQANYTASKGGVIALTKTVAKELGSRQIRCNAVAPGFVVSKMTDQLSDELKAKYAESIPLKRFGTGEDIANAVAFLASDEAAYITGQVLSVNGGMI